MATNDSESVFADLVNERFAFLLDYGFRLLAIEPGRLRFQSPCCFLDIYYGRSSYVVDLQVGLGDGSGETSEAFGIADILGAKNVREEIGPRPLQASTTDALELAVKDLAALTEVYAGEALRGDSAFYRLLRDRQQMESQDFLLSGTVRRLVRQSDVAFAKKDYNEVVRLLDGREQFLNDVSRRKLSYARAHSKPR